MNGGNGLIVDAAADLSANGADFADQSRGVAPDAQLTAVVMIPADGYLFEAESRQMRDRQVFDIEAEALNRRGFRQRATDAHAKRLEAALRIPERQLGREPDDQIDNPPPR